MFQNEKVDDFNTDEPMWEWCYEMFQYGIITTAPRRRTGGQVGNDGLDRAVSSGDEDHEEALFSLEKNPLPRKAHSSCHAQDWG